MSREGTTMNNRNLLLYGVLGVVGWLAFKKWQGEKNALAESTSLNLSVMPIRDWKVS
jgi:predicted negative regulator of RcsB-dependent stress response